MIQQPTSRKDALAIERLPDGGFVVTEHHRHASGYQDSLRFAAGSLADALAYIAREMGEPARKSPLVQALDYMAGVREFPTPPEFKLHPVQREYERQECLVEVRDHELGPQVTA